MSNNPVAKFLTAVLIFAAWAWVAIMVPAAVLLWYFWPRFQEPEVVTIPTPEVATSPIDNQPAPAAPPAGLPPGMRRAEGYLVAEDASESPGPSSMGGPTNPVAGVPVPEFPDPADVVPWSPKPGAFLYQMAWPGDPSLPGGVGTIWLYLPPGELTEASLPCVLIGAGGSNLLSGKALDDDDMQEHIPYVQAGFAVVAFSIDGDPRYTDQPYRKFKDAFGGMVNARNALEFTLAKAPEVDPERIFIAGHSSAATLALLYAEHEPRLKGCLAYMPVYDVVGALGNSPALRTVAPDAPQFLAMTSPRSFADRLRCPVFLFGSEKDGNVPVATVRRAAVDLRVHGKDVTLDVAPSGDHYRAMIESGIPAGIAWLKERT
ncbi:MAG TPA: prolyl oligopeptidase family serine peptidase [Pirellulaceae bacterium]|jgi:dienelactone hydrolase|nr:prolyl oligopeptidase family serine peptidase [Pirellulaceae bacterium]